MKSGGAHPLNFLQRSSMRLKRKRMGLTADLKVARRGLANARAAEAMEEAGEETP